MSYQNIKFPSLKRDIGNYILNILPMSILFIHDIQKYKNYVS